MIAVILATLMAGEYYVLISFDPLQALQMENQAVLLLLKTSYKAGFFIRIGFIVTYLFWVIYSFSSTNHLQRKQQKKSPFATFLLICAFAAACMLLLSFQKQAIIYLIYLYPVAACGVILFGLFLAPLLSISRRQRFGIRNDKQKIENKYSFNFRTHDGWINIVNPFRGVFIAGGAGAGKSFSLANPMIYQAAMKGYCGLIYDFKFPVLAE